jgi:hypothetical protein
VARAACRYRAEADKTAGGENHG